MENTHTQREQEKRIHSTSTTYFSPIVFTVVIWHSSVCVCLSWASTSFPGISVIEHFLPFQEFHLAVSCRMHFEVFTLSSHSLQFRAKFFIMLSSLNGVLPLIVQALQATRSRRSPSIAPTHTHRRTHMKSISAWYFSVMAAAHVKTQ